jgi:hypothetical protein
MHVRKSWPDTEWYPASAFSEARILIRRVGGIIKRMQILLLSKVALKSLQPKGADRVNVSECEEAAAEMVCLGWI